jgi:membrane fusion protein (multidrug efflux system)
MITNIKKVGMTMNRAYLFTVALLSSASVVLIGGCETPNSKANEDHERNTEPVLVRIVEAKSTPFAEILSVSGVVKAYENVMLSPEEGGVIREWKVKKGEWVKRGEIIALLNDDVLRAGYEAANAQYQIAELNFSKQEKVYSEQAISELQLKSAEYGRDAAKAQADLALARLERTKLRSPINGILNDRLADAGEFAPPAIPVAHIVNIGMVKVAAEVPEKHSASVAVGAQVRITVDAVANDTLTGNIGFVGSAVSPNNRTLPIEIVVPNDRRRLKPEMVAKVQIVRTVREDAILIDASVVQQVDRHKSVVYVENDGRAEERVVKMGQRQGTMVEIIDGLKPGDRVIVSGFTKLVDGQTVKILG